MKNREWIFRSLIPAILCVIALICFRTEYNKYQEQSAAERSELRSARDRIAELDEKKSSLQNELRDLDNEYNEKGRPIYTISPIFTSIDTEIFPKIVNIFENNEWKGVMCLSEDMIPGNGNTISRDNFYDLLDDGWDYCLYWNGEGSLHDFLVNMQYQLKAADIEFPSYIVFQSDCYTDEYDETLEKYDISLLVHHGEEDLPIPTLELQDEELIKFASCDWNNGDMEIFTNTAKEKGGVFGITIYYNFIKSNDNLEDVMYFFDYIKKIKDDDIHCHIGSISEARDLKENEASEAQIKEEEQRVYEERRAELEEEIRKVDEERKALVK